jgi:hypothetical protein
MKGGRNRMAKKTAKAGKKKAAAKKGGKKR